MIASDLAKNNCLVVDELKQKFLEERTALNEEIVSLTAANDKLSKILEHD